MSTTATSHTAFERGVGPLLTLVLSDKADEVVNFHADPTLQERIDELAGKTTEGELTEQEQAEYEGYVRANKFVSILQRQARRLLTTQS